MPDESDIPHVPIPQMPSPLEVRPPLPGKAAEQPRPASLPQDPLSAAMRERLVAATQDRWKAIAAAQQRKLDRVNALHQRRANPGGEVPQEKDPA